MAGSLIRQKVMEISEKGLKGKELVKAMDELNKPDTKKNEKLITKKHKC